MEKLQKNISFSVLSWSNPSFEKQANTSSSSNVGFKIDYAQFVV